VEKVRGLNMLEINDKIEDIDKRIESIQVQIDFLQNAITADPVWDEPEKPSRESVLESYKLRIEALKAFKNTLTQ